MPGPMIHVSVMRAVAKRLGADGYAPQGSDRINPKWVGPDPKELGQFMQTHGNYCALGAIGPDLFFFLPDFRDTKVGPIDIPLSSVLANFEHFLFGLYDKVDPYITKWEKYIGPISDGHRGGDQPPDRRAVGGGEQRRRRARQHPHHGVRRPQPNFASLVEVRAPKRVRSKWYHIQLT